MPQYVVCVLHAYIHKTIAMKLYGYRWCTALFIDTGIKVIITTLLYICPTEKIGHVIIITSYKHNNGGD